MVTTPKGHASAHNPHPTHFSSEITIVPEATSLLIASNLQLVKQGASRQ
jgi:hypothetical protein